MTDLRARLAALRARLERFHDDDQEALLDALPELAGLLERALDVIDAARDEDNARRCEARLSDAIAAFDAAAEKLEANGGA